MIACFSAIGCYIPPVFIFPRKRMLDALMKGAPQGAKGFSSSSGWIDSDLFLQWLSHFQSFVNSLKENQFLLILDNHSSHLSLQAINFACEHGIIMLSIPPYSSHKLQPLDRTFFGPLKTFYSQEVNKWMVNHPGKRVSDFDVAELVGKAYKRAATMQKAVNGFKVAGISPFNPHVFNDDDFAPATFTEVEEQPQENLHASDISNHATQSSSVTVTVESESNQTPSTSASSTHQNVEKESEGCIAPNDQPIESIPDCTTHNLVESESECSNNLQPCQNGRRVSVTDISPLPHAKILFRKRKSKRSEILTSSPFKKSLMAKNLSCNKSSNNVTKTSFKRLKLGNCKSMKKLKKNVQYKCIFCHALYEHQPKEDWIECCACKQWCHEKCSVYSGKGKFVCDIFL